jgi:hypothetical protein
MALNAARRIAGSAIGERPANCPEHEEPRDAAQSAIAPYFAHYKLRCETLEPQFRENFPSA